MTRRTTMHDARHSTGVISLSSQPTPSLAPNARRRGLSLHHHLTPSLAPNARRRELSLHHHLTPSLARNARRRGLFLFYHPLRPLSFEMRLFLHHHPIPSLARNAGGGFSLHHHPTPSLAPNARRRGLSPPPPYSLPCSKCETEGLCRVVRLKNQPFQGMGTKAHPRAHRCLLSTLCCVVRLVTYFLCGGRLMAHYPCLWADIDSDTEFEI